MNDSTRRAIRTVLDVVPAVLAVALVAIPLAGLDPETVAKVGALVGAVTVALAKVRNALEDSGAIPALLKAPPSAGADPLPDPPAGP
jgi:hypothetical protein